MEAKDELIKLLEQVFDDAHLRGRGDFHVYESFQDILNEMGPEVDKFLEKYCIEHILEQRFKQW